MDGFFDSKPDTLLILSAIAAAVFAVGAYLFIIIYPLFTIKMKVKKITPTTIVVAKDIYNEIVGYKLYDINTNIISHAILYFALMIFSVVVVIFASSYSSILGIGIAFICLPIVSLSLSQLKYITTIEFFEHGIVSKHFLGSEKTVLYDGIYSVQYRKLLKLGHREATRYIIISCGFTTISTSITSYEIDKVNNIFKNKNVNIAQ